MPSGLKGKAIAYTGNGGTNTEAVTFTNADNLVHSTTTSFADGDRIVFTLAGGTLPAELSTAITYYVINQDTDEFQVALTAGGDPVEFSTNGSITVNAEDAVQWLTISGASKIFISPRAVVSIWTQSQEDEGPQNGQASFKQSWDADLEFSVDANSKQQNSEVLEDIKIGIADGVEVHAFIWGQGATWTVI